MRDVTNPPADPQLIALDVDGTVMTYDEFISQEVSGAVADLRNSGRHVILATGRPLVATLPVARELGIDTGWVVCSNGSITARLDPELPEGFEVEHSVMFDPRPALHVLSEHMPGARVALEEVGVGYWVTEQFPEGDLHGAHTVMSFDELCARKTARIVVSDAPALTAPFRGYVAQLGLVAEQFTIAHTRWMDVAPAGVTKAYALERLRSRLDVPPEATIAVGDGNNDIAMLEWAGLGVAMGHAEAAVIAAADEIAGSILDDGLGPVLQNVLGESKASGRLPRTQVS